MEGLQKFVRHGADGGQAEFFGQINVAGAAEDFGCGLVEGADDVFLPLKIVAAAGTEVGNEKRRVFGILAVGKGFQAGCLFLQAAFALGQHFGRFQTAEVEFVDDGQDVNFKEHGLYHRSFDTDVQSAGLVGRYRYEAAFELEQFEIIDKIAFDEPQAAQVVQFALREFQGAQRVEFGFQIAFDFRQRVNGVRIVAAAEFVYSVRLRKLVQHDLQHGEFVKVGVEQGVDDGGAGHGFLLVRWMRAH